MGQVKINFSQIKDIIDDMDFCAKLAEEESVILLPGNMFFFFCNLSFITFVVNLSLLMMIIDTRCYGWTEELGSN